MSAIVKHFDVILMSVLLILIGADIALAYYALLPIQLAIALNLTVIGILIAVRAFREVDPSDKRFYLLWGLIMFVTAVSITLGYAYGIVIGFTSFLVGIGAVTLALYVKTFS